MICRPPKIPPAFRGGKFEGVLPCELPLPELLYIARRGPNRADRAAAREEIFRRRQARQRRFRNDK